MSRPDSVATAALNADIIRPGFFVYLDFLGDPVRVTSLGFDVTLTGTGFPELDGFAYSGVDAKFIDISPVTIKEGGSEQVTASLSGLREIDNDTLNLLGDVANWQGREALLWRMIRDETGTQQGAIQHYYTGYMVSLNISGSPTEQVITVGIETYLAAFSAASNRSYLDQELFDPGDLSARAAIAIANGTSGNPLTNNLAPAGNTNGSTARDGRFGTVSLR